MSSTSIGAALTVVLVLVAPATLMAMPQEATAAPAEIDSCTVIDDSGQYQLTEDVVRDEQETSRSSCFAIQADNVTIDGNGHTVNAGGQPIGIGVTIQGDNVTVTNLSVRNAGVGIQLEETNGSTVAHIDVEDVFTGVKLEGGSDNTIANNTVRKAQTSLRVAGENNTVIGNVDASHDGGSIQIAGSNHTIANNTASTSWFALHVEGSNHTIVGNDLAGGDAMSLSGGAIELRGTGHDVARNELTRVRGILVDSATGPISIHDNDFEAIYAVEVNEPQLCAPGSEGAEAVSVHNNTFEKGDYVYPMAGILNNDDETLNATNNYWGASDGPSSPEGENVSDPVTGTAADGNGVQVSDGVHFDPWRSEPVNQTAA